MSAFDATALTDLFFDEAREQIAVLEEFVVKRGTNLDEAFRAAHSLKGGAATVGLAELAELAHDLEESLDRHRTTGETDPHLGTKLTTLTRTLDRLAGGSEELRLRIDVDPACVMPSVRAQLTLQELEGVGTVVSVVPTPAEVQQQFTVVLVTSAGIEAIESLIKRLPDVSLTAEEVEPQLPIERRLTARVPIERLDKMLDLANELMIERARLARSLTRFEDTPHHRTLAECSERIWKLAGDLQEVATRSRLTPIGTLLKRFEKLAHDVASSLGKQVQVEIFGGETEVDRSVLDALGDPLIHMVRNAVDHGIGTPSERASLGKLPAGKISIHAENVDGFVHVTVADDGKGLDPERLRRSALQKGLIEEAQALAMTDEDSRDLIFTSGFSTATEVSGVSGRGVGMDIVRTNVERIGGRISVSTEVGKGTTFVLSLPLSLAVARCLLVRAGGRRWALPTTYVTETCVRPVDCDALASLLDLSAGESKFGFTVSFPGLATRTFGVEALVADQELVIKPISNLVGGHPAVTGASILDDGEVVLILDPLKL